MKAQWIILALVVAASALLMRLDYQHGAKVPASAAPPAEAADMALPEFTITPLVGDSLAPVAMSQLRGKFILINAWASWCPPCVKEFPDLLALAKEHPENLVLLTLSADRNEKAAIDFLQQYDAPSANILHAFDMRQSIARDRLQIHRYPESILVDASGQMIRKYAGLLRSEDLAEIRALLAPSAAQ